MCNFKNASQNDLQIPDFHILHINDIKHEDTICYFNVHLV